MPEDERRDQPGAEELEESREAAAPEPAGGDEESAPESSGAGLAGPAGDEAPEPPAADTPEPGDEVPEPAERPADAPEGRPDASAEEAVPGADLEPDLVLDDRSDGGDQYSEAAERYPEAAPEAAEEAPAAEAEQPPPDTPDEPTPAATPMSLAADARYTATGKRKTSVARVILKPGSGAYIVNGRSLEEFFPRPTLQKEAREPLATAGYDSRMDVLAKLHGGGVSSQAGALRHGVARALVEADPSLRGELKRRGFLTRDPRVKERKKAGLKKARKRPQFSKR